MNKRITAIMMCLMLTVSSLPLSAFAARKQDTAAKGYTVHTSSEVPATDITDVIEKFISCVEKFGILASDSGSTGKAAQFFTRFTGVASGVAGLGGGCVAILQMTGVIEDPTVTKLNTILDQLGSVQDQLKVIDGKLDSIAGGIIASDATAEEKDRANKAITLQTNWNKFNTDYIEKMSNLMGKYTGYIRGGASDWWNGKIIIEGDQYLLYTHIIDPATKADTVALTYSNSKEIPSKSDNGEVVDKSLCIGIPADSMPVTGGNFKVNTYKEDYIRLAEDAFIRAANEKKLIVDASSNFYTEWEALSDVDKKSKANKYATDLFNTMIYKIACIVMTEHDQFVIDVRNAYTNYCNNIIKQETGIDSLINVMYLTHAFEGEIKNDLDTYCAGMVAQAGVYGEFALSCVGQSSLQTDQDKASIKELWAKTINKLDSRRADSLTHRDNYCYIVNKVLDFEEGQTYSTASVTYHYTTTGVCYDKYSSNPWKLADLNKADFYKDKLTDKYAVVLYHYYEAQKKGNETFASFLHKYGVNISTGFDKGILTSSISSSDFDLSKGLKMTCRMINVGSGAFGRYFEDGKAYNINLNNDDAKDANFVVHDQALGNFMSASGGISVNQQCGARAIYAETSKWWIIDEVHAFFRNAGCESHCTSYNENKTDYYVETLEWFAPVYMLTLTPIVKSALPGGGSKEKDPLTYFKENYSLEYQDGSDTGTKPKDNNGPESQNGSDVETKPKDNNSPESQNGSDAKTELKANPLKIKARSAKVSYSKLKKKNQTLAVTKVMSFTKDAGDKKTYKLSSARKGKKSFKKYFKVNASTGKVTVKKKLKKGTYKVKVKVKAAGDKKYKASSWTAVTFKIIVK